MEKLVKLLDDFDRDLRPFEEESKFTIWDNHVELAKYLIENDVRQLVHGRWINDRVEAGCPLTDDMYLLDVMQCSVCGTYFDVSEARNYCPHCGAIMNQ